MDRPLLTDDGSRRARAVLIGCAIALIVIGVLVSGGSTADVLDGVIDNAVIGWFSGAPHLPEWLAYPASTIPDTVMTVLLAVACLAGACRDSANRDSANLPGRRLNGAVLGATAVPVTALLCDVVFKPAFHRTYFSALSYPSGHTASIFALATAVIILEFPPRVFWRVLGCVAACAVVIGVIGARWHYFSDTLGGAALGTGTVCGLALVLDLPPVRRLLIWRRHVR